MAQMVKNLPAVREIWVWSLRWEDPLEKGKTTQLPGGSEVKASACNAGDMGSIPGFRRSPGEENGNPLQYSCLENPMDEGAWWAVVHGVAKSHTWLSDFTCWLTHPSILAWRILWTWKSGGLQSTGSQRVGHDRVTDTSYFLFNLTWHRLGEETPEAQILEMRDSFVCFHGSKNHTTSLCFHFRLSKDNSLVNPQAYLSNSMLLCRSWK